MQDKKQECMLGPVQVGEILGIGSDTARDRMKTIPGVVNIGSGGNMILRIWRKDLENWISNKVVVMYPHSNRIERRKTGRRGA